MSIFNIAIIGAGPAGCTLAKLLGRSNMKVTIFEGEASPDVRSQGGTLDLHDITGLVALREAGLYDEFLKHARFDGEALAITDKRLTKYVNFGGGTTKTSAGRPEIDRRVLRSILINSLPKDVIRWGFRLRSISNDLALHFDHGVEKGFDLIVGADGAWSKVRPILTDQQPSYSGISGLTFTISDVREHHPDLYKLINRGSLFAFSDGKGIMSQQLGDGSLSVAQWATTDNISVKKIEQGQSQAVKESTIKEFEDWAPELQKLIQVADDDSMVEMALYMLPIGIQWKSNPKVTLIGDAAHLMTPFAGLGVNLAMEDAMNLAHAIVEAEKIGTADGLAQALKSFEDDMFKRAKRMQECSDGNARDMFFTEGAPRTVIERWLIRNLKARTNINKVTAIFAGFAVYSFYFFFKLFV